MGYGSNEAVEDAEDEYRENCTERIALIAARLVASGDASRKDAIEQATKYLRNERTADGDPTGVIAAEITFPHPSKECSPEQVSAIAAELREDAEDAARNL